MLRVAVSTVRAKADDPHLRSGTPSSIVRVLRENPRVQPVLLSPPTPRLQTAGRVLSYATKRLPGQHKVNWEVEPLLLRRMTLHMLAEAERTAPGELVMALGWLPLCHPSDAARVVYFNDSLYGPRLDRSPHWSGLGRRSRRLLPRIEGAALRNLRGVIMESQWAADRAIELYDLDAEKVFVVPGAANMITPPEVMRAAPTGQIRLLATGVEWHRKGMDIAVDAVDELRRRGCDASLDVLGVLPPDPSWHRDYVRFHGFLSKAEPEQLAKMEALYRDATVFLFPTRDEPYGIAPIEASAYGLPVIAPRLNAIPETVMHERSGLLVPADATGGVYANAVLRVVGDPDLYLRMSRVARELHVTRLNWTRSADLFADVFEGLAT